MNKTYVISISPRISFPDLVFFNREFILWKCIKGVKIDDIVYIYVSTDQRNKKEKEEHKRIKAERLKNMGKEGALTIEQNLPDKCIYYKTRVAQIHVTATKEELFVPTWINEKDWDKQAAMNDNVKLQLLTAYNDKQKSLLTSEKLSKFGFKKSYVPNNITDNTEMLKYIDRISELKF